MSDELIQDIPDGDNQDISNDTPTEDISADESPSDNTITTYCTVEDLINLFGDNVSGTIETNLMEGAIKRATGRIHNKLRARNVPLPDPENYSSAINAAATYYAACDCYGALYNGDDYQTQPGHWCNEAREILDDYIDAYWNSCADEEDQIQHQVVAHRNAPTYNQKRRYRRFY